MKTLLAAIFALAISVSTSLSQTSDADLRRAMRLDNDQRDANGMLPTLTAAEHLARADAYMANRMFPQAREHWQKVLDNYPTDPGLSRALFGTARSYMWEREYDKAVSWFEKLNGDTSKLGREGLAFKGASLIRLGKHLEAARVYEQYVQLFPDGERIESSHLNLIDAYRDGGKYDKAEDWVNRTVTRFAGKPAEVNALHARLRMEIHRERWNEAVAAADALLRGKSFAGSMTGREEVAFLRSFALEKSGKKSQAMDSYAAIPNSLSSYYGGEASERLARHGGKTQIAYGASAKQSADSPIVYRSELIAAGKKFDVDPRFLLAIMKQESTFRASAKSPAGARGLLQLVYDTALKYKNDAGYPNLHPDDLYTPATNIAVGAAYIADLKSQFGGLYEAIAASYNGGEDNAARWLNRSKPKDAGIFVSEIGFAESKAYVFKVMANYRIYKDLYTADLQRR